MPKDNVLLASSRGCDADQAPEHEVLGQDGLGQCTSDVSSLEIVLQGMSNRSCGTDPWLIATEADGAMDCLACHQFNGPYKTK